MSFLAAGELLLLVTLISKILVLPRSVYPSLRSKGVLLTALFAFQIFVGRHEGLVSLPGLSSTLNFFLSLGIFSLLLNLAFSIKEKSSSPKGEPHPKIRRLAIAGLGGLALQFFLGILQRASHSGLACYGFPLCTESFFPVPMTLGTSVAFMHRWWGVLMLGLFVHLAVFSAKKAPHLASLTRRALGFSLAQVMLGVGTVLGQLHSHSRISHAAVGLALWGTLFWIVHEVTRKGPSQVRLNSAGAEIVA